MRNTRHRFSRSELYELVWSEPMTKVASQFGLSNVGLKKICQRHDIPVPGRGYWRKLETGKRVRRRPLPPERRGVPSPHIEIVATSQTEDRETEEKSVELQASFEARPENRISVAEMIERPHVLTKATRRQLKSARSDDYGVIKCVSPDLFYLRIGPESVERALRILDALFRAFEVRGYKVEAAKRDTGYARVIVQEEAISFSLEERVRRRPHHLTDQEKSRKQRYVWSWAPKYDYIPAGALMLKLDTRYGSGLRGTWSDTRQRRVEDCLNDVIVAMVRLAEWKKQERRRAEEQRKRREEENARRAVLRARREREARALEQLQANALAWAKAQQLRAYIAAVKARAEAEGKSTDPGSETGLWLKWATDQADKADPLRESPVSILDEEVPRLLNSWENFDRYR